MRGTRLALSALLLVLAPLAATKAHAALFRFDYSGTIRSVGGTVTDGSLLDFTVGDPISGSFFFDTDSPTYVNSSDALVYENCIRSFTFGPVTAAGTQPSYSYFLLGEVNGYFNVQAYQQVGTGTVYDSFEFSVYFRLGDWWELPTFDATNSEFFLTRADIAWSPVHFTEVTAVFDSIKVTAVPEPASLLLLATGVCVAFSAALQRR